MKTVNHVFCYSIGRKGKEVKDFSFIDSVPW